MRTGLARLRQREYDIGNLGQGTIRDCGHRYQLDSVSSRVVGYIFEFCGFARPRQRQDNVVAGDHSEIAVAGFAWVHEKARAFP